MFTDFFITSLSNVDVLLFFWKQMLFIFAITDTMYAAQANIFVPFNIYVSWQFIALKKK